MPCRKLLDWEFLRRENSATETQIWRFSSSISFMFIPNFGEDEPNLTSIFSDGLVQNFDFHMDTQPEQASENLGRCIYKIRALSYVIDTTHLEEVVVVQSSRDVSLSFPP